jgi:uncharacterized heparinase superfamily protein
MYHAIVLEDLLDLININQVFTNAIDPEILLVWRATVKKMLIWLKLMSHPDGDISFFNDAALNIGSTYADLLSYARSLGIILDNIKLGQALQVYRLDESGYMKFHSDIVSVFMDVAPVGPDYIPGHAHADTLSFELSIFGHRVVVNGGTSCYGTSFKRLKERETRAHSTVEVDGENSSEVWGGFRVARRAKPFDLIVSSNERELLVSCSHNGYGRLKGKPIHSRKWTMTENDLTICDHIVGGSHISIARFILHPSNSVERINLTDWHVFTSSGKKVIINISSGSGFLEAASFAPEFGVSLSTQCLAVRLISGHSMVKFTWN